MALMERCLRRLLLLAVVIVSFIACGSSRSGVPSGAHPFDDGSTTRRPGVDSVVVFLPRTARVEPVWRSLKDELSEQFDVVAVEITEDSQPSSMGQAILQYSPKCVVLFDNTTTALYARYQASVGTGYPPAVILLTSFVDMYSDVKNAVSIAYEVPLVISASNLRTFISKPIERVGVVHRRAFAAHVQRQASLARVEKLTIVGAPVPDDATPRELAAALSDLLGTSHVDAIWILNDNALLTPEHLRVGWVPLLAKDPIPTIVGIPSLVTRDVPLGTFAVAPDLAALGVQAANVVYDLADAGFSLQESRVEQPLSVETVLDLDRARSDFGFKEEMRNEVGALAR